MEQSYKEKYEQAIERLKQWDREHPCAGYVLSDRDKFIFPELKESEDEKVRKELLVFCRTLATGRTSVLANNIDFNKWISWLEKQGDYANSRDKAQVGDRITKNEDGIFVNLSQLKRLAKPADSYCQDCTNRKGCMNCENGELRETEQKSADKVEPKFHKGDWIRQKSCPDKTFKISRVDTDRYVLDDRFEQDILFVNEDLWELNPADKPKFNIGDFIANEYCFGKVIALTDDAYLLDTGQGIPFSCEHNTHLWTIADARDGDVLVNWNNTVFIFKTIEDETVKFHIAYNEKWDAIKTPSTKLSHLGFPEPQFEFHPATKEQRDTLMKAMTDAGYTFDFENKKLKKTEQKPVEENKGNIGGISADWSEEDEKMFDFCCEYLDDTQEDWLKSLKDRVQSQPKQEWNEEDINMIDWLIRCCEEEHKELCNDKYGHQDIVSDLKRDCRKKWDWLESLKNRVAPQNKWKPSKEQMDVLRNLAETSIGFQHSKTLISLYEQLKKLKEE